MALALSGAFHCSFRCAEQSVQSYNECVLTVHCGSPSSLPCESVDLFFVHLVLVPSYQGGKQSAGHNAVNVFFCHVSGKPYYNVYFLEHEL